MREHDPDVVGLSVMTFQRRTALALIRRIRAIKPSVIVVAGGYDPSLASEAYESPERRRLRRPRRRRADVPRLAADPRERRRCRHHPRTQHSARARPATGRSATRRAAREPARGWRRACRPRRAGAARLHVPRPADRHRRNVPRLHLRLQLLLDHRNARPELPHLRLQPRARRHRRRRGRGARAIFLVDDNITLNVARFEALCRAIVDAGLNDIHYIVQAMTSSIASHGDSAGASDAQGRVPLRVPRDRERAGRGPEFLRASAKNAQREGGRSPATRRSGPSRSCTRRLAVVGGIIVGNPDDTRASIEANLEFARRYVDWPYIQHPTPYPGTPMTEDSAAAADRQRPGRGIQRRPRWCGPKPRGRRHRVPALAAERWMKVRHLPRVLRRYPGFVVRNGPQCCAHTFRGTTWRSVDRARERAQVSRATRRGAPPSARRPA